MLCCLQEAFDELDGRSGVDIYAPTDVYTDVSCLDNGIPYVAAGWGVHVENSNELDDYFGALADQRQTKGLNDKRVSKDGNAQHHIEGWIKKHSTP